MRRLGLLTLLLVVACQPSPALTPFRASAPTVLTEGIPPSIQQQQQFATPPPTHTPRPLFATLTPSPTLPPTLPQPSATATIVLPPTDPPQVSGYLLLGRPISSDGSAIVARTYAYGGTNGGRLQVHHGVDLVNPLGTPVHAVGDGIVVYAGNDLTTRFAPINNYYGNLVVIRHNFLSEEGLPFFTLYGHLSQVVARAGQIVHEGDVIGIVGATGIALGPHLHLEVRVGSPFDFDATRNPELWVRPYSHFAVLAGRVADGAGNPVYGALVVARSGATQSQTYTYGDDSVNSDPVLHENFTIGNLPAGDYAVTVLLSGREPVVQHIYLIPDQLTWLDAQFSP